MAPSWPADRFAKWSSTPCISSSTPTLQMKASSLGGEITFLSAGEVAAVLKTRSSFTYERAWEYLVPEGRASVRQPADGRASRRQMSRAGQLPMPNSQLQSRLESESHDRSTSDGSGLDHDGLDDDSRRQYSPASCRRQCSEVVRPSAIVDTKRPGIHVLSSWELELGVIQSLARRMSVSHDD